MSYDQRCHDLAEVFLEDEQFSTFERARRAHQLAQVIQNAIESFLEDIAIAREGRYETGCAIERARGE